MHPKLTTCDLQRLHDAYADGVFRYFWAATRQEGDAEDLVQEFFVRLATSTSDLAAIENERAWIYTVARNLMLTWHRKQAARPHDFMDPAELDLNLELIAADGHDPDAEILGQELLAALAELPPEQRIVAQLRLWEGLTLREISTSQGIPLQTAASRLRYALERLRALLSSLYAEIK